MKEKWFISKLRAADLANSSASSFPTTPVCPLTQVKKKDLLVREFCRVCKISETIMSEDPISCRACRLERLSAEIRKEVN